MNRENEITCIDKQHGVNTIREELLKDLSEDTIKIIDDLMIGNLILMRLKDLYIIILKALYETMKSHMPDKFSEYKDRLITINV